MSPGKGAWPRTDAAGNPLNGWRSHKVGSLCGPYFFRVFQIAADLDYLCNYFHLQHFNARSDVCMFCEANRSDCPWTDARLTASWRMTVRLGDELLLTCHPLFTSGIGITLAHICPDILHCLDLGTAQHLLGSVFWMLVWNADFRGTLNERLGMVWNEITNSYGALNTPVSEQVPHAKVAKICEKSRSLGPIDYPVLGSKGAQGRHAVPVLHDVCRRIVGHLEAFDHVTCCLAELSTFYDIVSRGGMYLGDEVAPQARDALDRYLIHYNYLADYNMRRGRHLFYATEKCNHYPAHIAWCCSYYNPKQGWTYQDEDFMGKIADIAASTVRGLGPCRLAGALLFRYQTRVHLRFDRRRAVGW